MNRVDGKRTTKIPLKGPAPNLTVLKKGNYYQLFHVYLAFFLMHGYAGHILNFEGCSNLISNSLCLLILEPTDVRASLLTPDITVKDLQFVWSF